MDAKYHSVVLGHSYIRSLGEHMKTFSEDRNLRLCGDYDVIIQARGGPNIQKLLQASASLLSIYLPADDSSLFLGGNDLCDSRHSPKKLCVDLVSIAEFLRSGVGV
ncbi:hypothetical protein KP79_PYT08480 [Mizuhopecten yessoensis]|uniref:Uncharacterized protein n=1 Tax=Mizuhopecten yessoensis TaxID=6573 RepID=A0A210QC54_MIZYE|nr:hypothetical protein KP79_PYT08480 [Mizuhopecten yessoensis]